MKTTTICFVNNKGGSGKSTTCSNVGAAMALAGKRVLLVDGDMQLNLSLSFFPEDKVLEMAAGEKNLYRAIREQKDLMDYRIATPYEKLDLIPSSTLMSSIEYDLFTKWQRELILQKCLKSIREAGIYDYILIDAPPTLGRLGDEYSLRFRPGGNSGGGKPLGNVRTGKHVRVPGGGKKYRANASGHGDCGDKG